MLICALQLVSNCQPTDIKPEIAEAVLIEERVKYSEASIA